MSWLYEYWNPRPITKEGLGAGLEIGVQLSGDWYQRSMHSGGRLYQPGTIHRLHSGERYGLSFEQRRYREA